MFEKFKEKIKELSAKNSIDVDSSQFNDPVATNTQWQPMKAGGANFKTNILISVSPSVYRYQLSTGAWLFLGVFAVFGIGAILIGLNMLSGDEAIVGLFLILFGSIFVAAAYFFYKSMGIHKVFDQSLGYLWVGRNQPKFAGDNKDKQKLIYFSEIHALQIVSERVSSKNGSYYSHELNLVLKDASRFNLVDHGNHAQVISDANKLSDFMGKPLWDVSIE
ncbi:MAG: hypothetical protein JKY19_01110 [Alcanivoracaceae bacterium]|nr:hypothetical protein [Alcanivoracaceae bacterium]